LSWEDASVSVNPIIFCAWAKAMNRKKARVVNNRFIAILFKNFEESLLA
jgi:hypothetical protein